MRRGKGQKGEVMKGNNIQGRMRSSTWSMMDHMEHGSTLKRKGLLITFHDVTQPRGRYPKGHKHSLICGTRDKLMEKR